MEITIVQFAFAVAGFLLGVFKDKWLGGKKPDSPQPEPQPSNPLLNLEVLKKIIEALLFKRFAETGKPEETVTLEDGTEIVFRAKDATKRD